MNKKRSIVITGASSGLGECLRSSFSKSYRVINISRTRSKCEYNIVNDFKDFAKSNGKKGLDYGDDYVMWDGTKYERKNGKIKYKGNWYMEGSRVFPWEQKAYNKEKS